MGTFRKSPRFLYLNSSIAIVKLPEGIHLGLKVWIRIQIHYHSIVSDLVGIQWTIILMWGISSNYPWSTFHQFETAMEHYVFIHVYRWFTCWNGWCVPKISEVPEGRIQSFPLPLSTQDQGPIIGIALLSQSNHRSNSSWSPLKTEPKNERWRTTDSSVILSVTVTTATHPIFHI